MRKLILLCVALLLIFSACATNEPESFDIDFAQDGDGKIDLEGYKFNYLLGTTRAEVENVLGYLTGTLLADACIERLSSIENEYNCNIEEKYSVFERVAAEIQYATAAGQAGEFSAIQTESYYLYDAVRGGLLLPLDTVDEVINYKDEEKWGTRWQREEVTWNNKIFGMVPMYWPEYFYNSADYIFVYNIDTLREIGASNPHEYIENGTWTWDTLDKIVGEYTHTGGTGETVYGLVCDKRYFAYSALSANGVGFVQKSGDSWIPGLYTTEAIETFQWTLDFMIKHEKDIINSGGLGGVESFVAGAGTMVNTRSSFVYNASSKIAYNVSDFSILPFPTGPHKEYGDWSGWFESMLFCVAFPINVKDSDASAIIIDKLYEPLPGYETEEDRLDYCSQYVFHDELDGEILYKMTKKVRLTYHRTNPAANIVSAILDQTQTIAQALESSKNRYDTFLENEMIPVEESIEYIWGESND